MSTALEIQSKLSGASKGIELDRCNLNEIYANKDLNMRRAEDGAYDGEQFTELVSSIKASGGILTPLQVARLNIESLPADKAEEIGSDVKYVLVAGFRRYYALADLAEDDPSFLEGVPVVISEAAESDEVVFKVVQAVENIQRKNCSPLEIGETFDMMVQSGLKQREVAKMIGMSEPTVSQYMSLLSLPSDVKKLLNQKLISFSHVREILRAVKSLKPSDDTKELQITQLAKAAKNKSFSAFVDFVDKLIDDKEHEGDGSDATVQRDQYKMRKATDLDHKYLEKCRAEYKKAQEENNEEGKTLWQTRADTLKFVLNMDSTMSKDLEPWEEEIAKQEQEAKFREDSKKTKEKYVKALAAKIRETFNTIPEPGQARPTLTECFAHTRNDLEVQVAKTAEEGKTLFDVFAFDFTVDDLMDEVKKTYDEREAAIKKAAEERAAAAAKKKAEKEAEEAKAKAEGREVEKKPKKAKKDKKEDKKEEFTEVAVASADE